MRTLKFLICLSLAASASFTAHAGSLKMVKVLPQYIDREARHAISPSLFDRDAYQAHLRRHPEERFGMRFAIQWKGPNSVPLRLRLEMRGARGKEPTTAVLEEPVRHRGWFANWALLQLAGEQYQQFGELSAWRATLWNGNQQVAEQKSFLW